mgnify:CR=1 FL=1
MLKKLKVSDYQLEEILGLKRESIKNAIYQARTKERPFPVRYLGLVSFYNHIMDQLSAVERLETRLKHLQNRVVDAQARADQLEADARTAQKAAPNQG